MTGPRRPHRPRLGSRHPVLALAGVALLLVAALVGLRASGAANPWVARESAYHARTSDRGADGVLSYAGVVLRNRGLLPVDVTTVALVGPGARDARLFVRRVGAARRDAEADDAGADRPLGPDLVPAEHLRLAGGEHRELVVLYRDPCDHPNPGTLHIEVASVLGRHRSLGAAGADDRTTC